MTLLAEPTFATSLPAGTTDAALLELLRLLKRSGYRFVTPTPATHARVLARQSDQLATDLRDVFGWNLPFTPATLDSDLLDSMSQGDAVEKLPDGRLRSRFRVSSLGDALFLHSSYPTKSAEAVFFGPDSYRFANLITPQLSELAIGPGAQIVDIGGGAGIGAIVAAHLCPRAHVAMTDINDRALRLARLNAASAQVAATYLHGSDLNGLVGQIDIALANPPYIIDAAGRDYRDGGDMHGARVALDMATMATARLAVGGRLILYTGSAIIAGRDALKDELSDLSRRQGCSLQYWEIDPDVFGEELSEPAYCEVERLALVAAVIVKSLT